MRVYEIDISPQEGDQVFSYYRGETLLHFNVSLLARLREQMPNEFRRITMTLSDAEYNLCIRHRGIEEPKVERLTGKSLREPGYAVLFDDTSFSIVDGHHRLVRRYRGGVRTMDFWVTHEPVWRHVLVSYTPEEEAQFIGDIPARVDEPATIVSPVIVHGDDE